MSVPSAWSMRGLLAPARTSMPKRVRATSTYSPAATASPPPMMNSRYAG